MKKEIVKTTNLSVDEELEKISISKLTYWLEHIQNPTHYHNKTMFAHELYKDALMGGDHLYPGDIRLCKKIIQRVDGGKTENQLSKNAIDIVMEMPRENVAKYQETDTGMVGLIKTIFRFAYMETKQNYQKKTEKDMATDFILTRLGGRKTIVEEDAKLEEITYEQVEWLNN